MVNVGEPAEKGGLKVRRNFEFNGKKIMTLSLQRSVAESAVESKVTVKVWKIKIKSFTVKLVSMKI